MAYMYNPQALNVSWDDGSTSVPITGFASGTFLSIEFTSPQWNPVEGLDGNVAFSPKSTTSAKCSITLQQGSFGNKVLTQELSTQDRDMSSLSQRNLTIYDPSGTYNLKFQNAIIQSQPTIKFGGSATDGTREWVFYSPNVTYLEQVNEVNRG